MTDPLEPFARWLHISDRPEMLRRAHLLRMKLNDMGLEKVRDGSPGQQYALLVWLKDQQDNRHDTAARLAVEGHSIYPSLEMPVAERPTLRVPPRHIPRYTA